MPGAELVRIESLIYILVLPFFELPDNCIPEEGDLPPMSPRYDYTRTKTLKEVCKIIDTPPLDAHLALNPSKFSFQRRGVLWSTGGTPIVRIPEGLEFFNVYVHTLGRFV